MAESFEPQARRYIFSRNPAVRAVAEGHRLGMFAGAPGDGFLFRDVGLQRNEAGPFM